MSSDMSVVNKQPEVELKGNIVWDDEPVKQEAKKRVDSCVEKVIESMKETGAVAIKTSAKVLTEDVGPLLSYTTEQTGETAKKVINKAVDSSLSSAQHMSHSVSACW